MANPFKTLGLTPEIIKLIRTDEDAFFLAKVMFRTLSKRLHPDKGGITAQFIQIKEAMAELEDPDLFREAKEEYLLPRREQISKLAAEVEKQNALVTSLAKQMMDYIKGVALQGGIPVKGKTIIVNVPRVSSTTYIEKERIFNLLTATVNGLRIQPMEYLGRSPEHLALENGVYQTEDSVVIVREIAGNKTVQEWSFAGESREIEASIVGTYLGNVYGLKAKSFVTIEGISLDFEKTSRLEFYRLEALLKGLDPEITTGKELVVARFVEGDLKFSLFGKIFYIY